MTGRMWWVEWTEPFTDEPTKPVHQSEEMTKAQAEDLAAELERAGKDDVHLAYADDDTPSCP
jgi:hypothetical protein